MRNSSESLRLAIPDSSARFMNAHKEAYDQNEMPHARVATASRLPSDPGYVSIGRAEDQAISSFPFSSALKRRGIGLTMCL